MQHLPDPYKIDVIKFFDSAPGKALMEVLKARCPASPDAQLPHSTKLSMYDQRAGAEFMLGEMLKVAHESSQDQIAKAVTNPLLDPRD